MDVSNFIEVWKVPGVTAFLTALLGLLGQNWLTKRREERVNQFTRDKEEQVRIENLRYQALRVVLALEKFAISCAGIVSDADMYRDSRGSAGSKVFVLPCLMLPDDTDWKYFEIATASKILAFENQISDSNNSISFDLSMSGDPEGTDEAEVQAGLCGYIAIQLADGLRREHELGVRLKPLHGWDYVAALKTMHDRKQEFYKQVRALRD